MSANRASRRNPEHRLPPSPLNPYIHRNDEKITFISRLSMVEKEQERNIDRHHEAERYMRYRRENRGPERTILQINNKVDQDHNNYVIQEQIRIQEKRISTARDTMKNETSRYHRSMKEYLNPILHNQEAMKRAAETFLKLNEDPRFLAKSSAAFLENLESIPDALEDEIGSETEETTLDLDVDEPEDINLLASNPELHPTKGKLSNVAQSTGFMQWKGFSPHPLSKDSDIVGDRQKSFLSYVEAIEVGITTPVVGITTKGLFGILARVLQRKDYRAYFKASARMIYLPDSISKKPDELELEEYERNLFGTGKFVGDSSMMTCLTYNDQNYGTITLFKVEMADTDEGRWPERIRPIAAMIRVPKKLLKKTAKSVSSSKKTKLQVKAKEFEPLEWLSFTSESRPKIANSPSVRQEKMPESLREALVVNHRELKTRRSKTANIAIATIPAMIAWLHVKASYLEGINMEGTEIRRRKGDRKIRRIVRWKSAPKMIEHEGDNPCVVVLHPDSGDWVTAPVYWG